MIEAMGDVLSREKLLAAYRNADEHLGDRATLSEQQRLRRCRRMVVAKIENLKNLEEERIGGTLADEKLHYEARLIKRALEQENGSITRAARLLGLTHQGLTNILDGRHSKSLAGDRRPKETSPQIHYAQIECRLKCG